MPTYQYVCTECHHGFEQFQTFSEDSLTVCPECAGRLRKVFNAVGVVFKGSGFYKTDSRAKENGSVAPAAKSSDSSSSASSSSSSSSSASSSSSSSTDSSNGKAASNGAKTTKSEASKAGSTA